MVSELLFIQHGEHSIGEDNGETFSGLTNKGCDEMHLLIKSYGRGRTISGTILSTFNADLAKTILDDYQPKLIQAT